MTSRLTMQIADLLRGGLIAAVAAGAAPSFALAQTDADESGKFVPTSPTEGLIDTEKQDLERQQRKARLKEAKANALSGAAGSALPTTATAPFTGAPPANDPNNRSAQQARNPTLAQAPAAVPTAADVIGDGTKGSEPTKKANVELSTCKPVTGKLSFNFDKATINEVLDQISRIKCMNFILSDAVKGKNDITIVSRSPVTVASAYAAFLSALEANGMALVPAGAFWKVVERKEAQKMPIPTYEMRDGTLQRLTPDEKRQGDVPNSDAEVTLLYEVKYANKDQVQNLIRNLMSKNADLQAPAGNLLILSDSGTNILRILEILDKIDVEGTSNRLNVISLSYADVASVAQKLNEIFGTNDKAKGTTAGVRPRAIRKADDPAGIAANAAADAAAANNDDGDISDVSIEKIIPDDRTNQLLIISSPKAFERVKEVLRLLDVPSPNDNAELKMWVVPLANADAQKATSTLTTLASGAAAKRPTGAADKGGVKAKEAERAAALFEGEVKISADEATNSLVVVASGRDFRALRKVIEQLDMRRPQVFVEAAIMEVALAQNRNVSLNAYAAAPVAIPGSTTPGIFVAANEGGKQIFQSSAKVATGLQLLQQLASSNRLDATAATQGLSLVDDLSSLVGLVGFVGPSIPILRDASGNALVSLPSVSTVVNLLQSNTNVDILSTPHIMTMDNEKAEISVGQRVPVVRGIAPVGGAGSLGFGGLQQVSYEDVKLKFAVTPHVNSDGEVRIELEQDISDLGGQVSVGNGLSQPIITTRTVKNTVVARDQQTIAIAGLIQDRKGDNESKVPFFGDIPIIGWLFKTWGDNKSKTNLLIVLTPYIVRDERDFQRIYERKMAERKQFVDAYFSDARVYNPYVDYEKKTGPVGELLKAIGFEMEKIENGGKGHGEEVITHDGSLGGRGMGRGTDDSGAAPTNPEAPDTGAPDARTEGGGEAVQPESAPEVPQAPPPAVE